MYFLDKILNVEQGISNIEMLNIEYRNVFLENRSLFQSIWNIKKT